MSWFRHPECESGVAEAAGLRVVQVWQEGAMLAKGGAAIGGMQVGHAAHLAGAVAGVLLVLALARLPKAVEV